MRITKYALIALILTFSAGYATATGYSWLNQSPRIGEFVYIHVEPPRIETLVFTPLLNEDPIQSWERYYDELNNYKIKLLTTGAFHGDEVKAKTSEKWLGLFKENDKYFLRYNKIKVSRVHDDIVDGENEKTGKKVSISGRNEPVFLLKNAETLRVAEVKTLFHGIADNRSINSEHYVKSLEKGFVQDYELNGKKYQLRVEETLYLNNENLLKLVIESAEQKQTIYSMKNAVSLGTLYWAGDLDRDDKPDLFVNLYLHYNVIYQTLFLSSEADRNSLVKQVAVFWTVGC